jgi:hypothetical protein
MLLTCQIVQRKKIKAFDQDARHLIGNSDTFFVASHFNKGGNDTSEGADVSHRGGKAGLLFIDFDSGHVLMLTGRVEIIWDPEQIIDFAHAQRLWQFHLELGRWLHNALPLRWQ